MEYNDSTQNCTSMWFQLKHRTGHCRQLHLQLHFPTFAIVNGALYMVLPIHGMEVY